MKRIALLLALVVAGCNRSAPANDSRQSVAPVPQVDVVQVVSQKLEATERLP
jgi:PBP1b-binding outer membrane lipoprotein LpoB